MIRFLNSLLILLFALSLCPCESISQNSKIDSLLNILKKDKEDTNKVIHIAILSDAFLKSGNYDSIFHYSNKALKLSQKLRFKKGIARSYGSIASYYAGIGNYTKALDYCIRSLKINEALNDKKEIALGFNGIGLVFSIKGDSREAMKYYFKALYLSEEIRNKELVANILGNIGIVYSHLADKADVSMKDSLYELTLNYYFKALKTAETHGDKRSVSRHFSNIGIVYANKGDILKALEYGSKGLKIAEKLGLKRYQANAHGSIGSFYIAQKKYLKAFYSIYKSISIADSIKAMSVIRYNYERLSELYEKSTIPLPDSIEGKILTLEEMRLRSLYYFKRFVAIRDTMFSQESQKKQIGLEMNYEFEKKEAATKAQQDKKDALTKEELKQKEQERNYFIIGFSLVLLLAAFIFRGYRVKQQANEIIITQKHIVEEKQKEILDSIHYAKRIQSSLLPTEKYIEKSLKRLQKN